MLGKYRTQFFFIKTPFSLPQLINKQSLQTIEQSIHSLANYGCIFFQQYFMLTHRHCTGTFPQRTTIQFLFKFSISQLCETFFPQFLQTCRIHIFRALHLRKIMNKNITSLILNISFRQQVLRTYFQQFLSITMAQIIFQP